MQKFEEPVTLVSAAWRETQIDDPPKGFTVHQIAVRHWCGDGNERYIYVALPDGKKPHATSIPADTPAAVFVRAVAQYCPEVKLWDEVHRGDQWFWQWVGTDSI